MTLVYDTPTSGLSVDVFHTPDCGMRRITAEPALISDAPTWTVTGRHGSNAPISTYVNDGVVFPPSKIDIRWTLHTEFADQ
jgi:hypothetical protein